MALHGRILSLRQDNCYLYYRASFPSIPETPLTPPSSIPPSSCDAATEADETEQLVKHYLNLQPNLSHLYLQWSSADPNFRKKAPRFTGVRILKQDAWEALIGFICSSNNNIIRISQMVDKLCARFGPFIGHLDGVAYYDFPDPAALVGQEVEHQLRELGFGYRAKYINQTARTVAEERAPGWLESLRNPESPVLGGIAKSAGEWTSQGRKGYREAHESLLMLQGVGPKVADCVCLMGLGWGEAVPVDTHFWQIAQRDYKLGKGKHSSMTKATYDTIANHFRGLWGREAGWAHSVLFAADLRVFSEKLAAKAEIKDEFIEASSALETIIAHNPVVQQTRVKREQVVNDANDQKAIIRVEEIAMTSAERVKKRRRR